MTLQRSHQTEPIASGDTGFLSLDVLMCLKMMTRYILDWGLESLSMISGWDIALSQVQLVSLGLTTFLDGTSTKTSH
jgi:hypothetical protein